MKCPNCGSENESDHIYCANCGANLRKVEREETDKVSVKPDEALLTHQNEEPPEGAQVISQIAQPLAPSSQRSTNFSGATVPTLDEYIESGSKRYEAVKSQKTKGDDFEGPRFVMHMIVLGVMSLVMLGTGQVIWAFILVAVMAFMVWVNTTGTSESHPEEDKYTLEWLRASGVYEEACRDYAAAWNVNPDIVLIGSKYLFVKSCATGIGYAIPIQDLQFIDMSRIQKVTASNVSTNGFTVTTISKDNTVRILGCLSYCDAAHAEMLVARIASMTPALRTGK